MTTMGEKVHIRITLKDRNQGRAWVPYETLIGHTIRNRPIIGRLWQHVACTEEFASKGEAIAEATRRARMRILELFGHVEESDMEWEVIHDRRLCPETWSQNDRSNTRVTEPIPSGTARSDD